MNRRNIVTGIVIVLLIAGYVYWSKSKKTDLKVPVGEIASSTTENKIEDKFKLTIPDNLKKAELKDVSGGDGSAIATRDEKTPNEEITILADLPDPSQGSFYQGWINNGTDTISLGKLVSAKGGWMVNYKANKDVSAYSKVTVTLQEKSSSQPEKTILEGSF